MTPRLLGNALRPMAVVRWSWKRPHPRRSAPHFWGGTAGFPGSSCVRHLSQQQQQQGPTSTARSDLPPPNASSVHGDPHSAPPAAFVVAPELADAALKGVGQVIFLNSVRSGSILLGSLAVGDPYLALLAATGTVASTAAARRLSLDSASTSNGLLSYNGCLVGCAVAVFVAPYGDNSTATVLLTALPATAAGAAAATAVTASLGKSMQSPQWTYAFNAVALMMLLRLQPLAPPAADAALSDPAAAAAVTTAVPLWALASAPLKGLSQIFVVESSLTGLGLVAGIASYSPLLAVHALLGSALGCLTGWALGAPSADMAAGLWGYNSALTSLGVGVFFTNTRGSWALSAAGAVATAGVFGALQPVFGAFHTPCLTLPFCVTMTGCYHLAGASPHWILTDNPHSPEQNQAP